MEDSKIIGLYFDRNEDAILETKKKYGGSLVRICQNIVKSRPDAEECENDTYLHAWNAIPPQKPVNFFAWLVKVGRNLCYTRLRDKSALKHSAAVASLSEEMAECLPDPLSIDRVIADRDAVRIIERYLLSQEKERRFLFVRRYFYGDDHAEIARLSGKSTGSVRVTLCRMREEIREILIKEGFEP